MSLSLAGPWLITIKHSTYGMNIALLAECGVRLCAVSQLVVDLATRLFALERILYGLPACA